MTAAVQTQHTGVKAVSVCGGEAGVDVAGATEARLRCEWRQPSHMDSSISSPKATDMYPLVGERTQVK